MFTGRQKFISFLSLILSFAVLLTGCTKISTFGKTIVINAPASIVFEVITDYEAYDELLPALHDEIEIVSDIKEGRGVVWRSTGSFRDHSFTTEWTVTEFEKDHMVRMEDLEDGAGYTVLRTKPLDNRSTEYTMEISTKMYPPYEKDFFSIYEDEMATVKKEAERRAGKE